MVLVCQECVCCVGGSGMERRTGQKISVILHNVAAVLLSMLRTGFNLGACMHFAVGVICIKLLINH